MFEILDFIFTLLGDDKPPITAACGMEIFEEQAKKQSDNQVRARHIAEEEENPYIKELMENRMDNGIYDFKDLRPDKYK